MAQEQAQIASEATAGSLAPGTYRSLLPIVDEILAILHAQTVSPERISPAQSSDQVAPKAKELSQALEGMKMSALSLPGGNLSTEDIGKLLDVLESEGDKRRRILSSFETLSLPTVEELASAGPETKTEGESLR
ncbi:hypothetical protein B9479_003529 [Cryptococcus floricola]|uniref:Mediator of RNA polymerase II transcription subunit 9 n=1 Tax=Cryptococcus floricola TaxID=2591691 RepID=A0A5D3B083_9TREE|nr:hypothetical protein B9479_003529 [Cryptococcus floricola]